MAWMPNPANPARVRGFTLVELCVTMSIVSILAASAVPSLSDVSQRMRLRDAERELLLTLSRARSEAIASGRRAAIAPRDGGSWSSGWRLFGDLDDDGRLDEAETVLLESTASMSGLTLSADFGTTREVVLSYSSTGFVRRPGSNALMMGRMVLSDGTRSRVFCFSIARVRVIDGTSCS